MQSIFTAPQAMDLKSTHMEVRGTWQWVAITLSSQLHMLISSGTRTPRLISSLRMPTDTSLEVTRAVGSSRRASSWLAMATAFL